MTTKKEVSFLESIEKYKAEEFASREVERFVSQGLASLKGVETGKIAGYMWIHKRGSGYRVQLGRLPNRYFVGKLDIAVQIVNSAIEAARNNDSELVAQIMEAYKRVPKPKETTAGEVKTVKRTTVRTPRKKVPEAA